MFITREQAAERLKDPKNVFRDGDRASDNARLRVPVPPPAKSEHEGVLPDEILDESGEPSKDPTYDTSPLDEIIGMPRRKPFYRGRTDTQAAIAETSMILGPTAGGQVFGLGPDQTGAYEHGFSNNEARYGTHKPSVALKRRIDVIKEELAERAANKLGLSLDALTPSKISQVKRATNLARIAKDMATIVEKVSPDADVDKGATHFHIYRPEIKNITQYNKVEIGATLEAKPHE